MFSLAYVILPFSEDSPAQAIAASMARFRGGKRGDVPDEWLRFHDETSTVQEMHESTYSFEIDQGLRTSGGESWYLNSSAVREEMARRNKGQWTVRFADIEPDMERFAERFLDPFERHPVTGGFGSWLNGLGRWDWWELGRRFDGAITRQPRREGRLRSTIFSGPSAGRDMLEKIEDSLGNAIGQVAPAHVDVAADCNVELVSKLREELVDGTPDQLPGVLVLPPGSIDDDLRWIRNWPTLGPAEALAGFGLPPDASWRNVVGAVYDRFEDHWAAGVAFHH